MNSLDEEVCTIKPEANTVFAISQPAGYWNFRVDQFKICVNDFVGWKLVTSEKYAIFYANYSHLFIAEICEEAVLCKYLYTVHIIYHYPYKDNYLFWYFK